MVDFMLAGRLEAAEYALTPYPEPWGRSKDSDHAGQAEIDRPEILLGCSLLHFAALIHRVEPDARQHPGCPLPLAGSTLRRAPRTAAEPRSHFPKYLRLGAGWPFFAGIRKPSALRM
jgi:hypothetical protein